MMAYQAFDQNFFGFFEALTENNERGWFQANKAFFESAVSEPMRSFISAIGPYLSGISEHFVADPRKSGGSMFRIYRDTRFSKDKTPYKTHAASQFRHVLGKDVHAPGFYFHADTEQIFCGAGVWHPASEALAKVRSLIVEKPEEWLAVKDDPALGKDFEYHGERLKRPPRGFPADHPLIEDIKRKDFVAGRAYPRELLLESDLPERIAADFRTCGPLVRFLCKALEVPF